MPNSFNKITFCFFIDIKYDIVDKNKESDVNEYDFANEGKYKFDVNYEGIYIFGGLDENLKETNDLFILHCFRNRIHLHHFLYFYQQYHI